MVVLSFGVPLSFGLPLGAQGPHRMLYHRVPMMRGDDVAELQRQLNALGFDAGTIDGIFGPGTRRAITGLAGD